MTPNFFDMDRITTFLRPMIEGGMGAGREDWIGDCLRIGPARMRAAIDALSTAGKIVQGPDGSWRLS